MRDDAPEPVYKAAKTACEESLMNADAITKQIMKEIGQQAVINPEALKRIEYAISRSVGSIISGLTCDCRSEREHYAKRQTGVQPDGRGVPTERPDSAQMFADDAKYNTTGDVPCCGHCPILTSSKTRSDRPVASTTESPAFAPACGPERVADSGYPIPAHVYGWPDCAPAEVAIEQMAAMKARLEKAERLAASAYAVREALHEFLWVSGTRT